MQHGNLAVKKTTDCIIALFLTSWQTIFVHSIFFAFVNYTTIDIKHVKMSATPTHAHRDPIMTSNGNVGFPQTKYAGLILV